MKVRIENAAGFQGAGWGRSTSRSEIATVTEGAVRVGEMLRRSSAASKLCVFRSTPAFCFIRELAAERVLVSFT